MSSGNLGNLEWTISADDSRLDAVLDRAEQKVRAFGARLDAAMSGSGGGVGAGPPSSGTFAGPLAGPNLSAVPFAAPGAAGGLGWGAASPNWSYLLGQQTSSVVSGLTPTSSPNWSYLMGQGGAGAGGGGGLGGGRGIAGAFRPMIIAHLGMRLAQEAVAIEDRNRALDRVMATGTLMEQAQAGLSYVKENNVGLEGWLRRHSAVYRHFNGDIDEAQTLAEQAVKSAGSLESSDRAQQMSRRIQFDTQFINSTEFGKMAEGPMSKYQGVIDQVTAFRRQAAADSNPVSRNALMSTADAMAARAVQQRDTQMQHNIGAYVVNAFGRGIRSFGETILSAASLGTSASAAAMTASGNAFGAQYTQQASEFAQDEAQQSNPVIRFMMKLAHGAILRSAIAGNERQQRIGTEDTANETLGLTANTPGLPFWEQANIRMQVLQKQKDQALERYKAANPGDNNGYNALSANFDERITQVGRSSMEGIRLRAISLQASAFRLDNRPLEAQLEEANAEPDEELRNASKAEIRRRFELDSARIARGQGTNRELTQARLARSSPFTSQAIAEAGAGIDEANQLKESGRPGAAKDTLVNALFQVTATRDEYLNSFKAKQIDLRNVDVTNAADNKDPNVTLKEIQKKFDDVIKAIENLASD